MINLAACHHLKKEQLSQLGQIIKEADCLSSGMDRESEEAMKDSQDESGWDAFKKKRMVSILETIKNSTTVNNHLPIAPMSLSKDSFPKKSFKEDPDYVSLWKSFQGEFKFIQANTYHAFSETLLNLLYKYTSCIPASTINFPDVSLYDHLKTTAALAVCLYDYQEAQEASDKPFLLVGADFSGIQSYIYQIVSKYAGKNLKGRSFYLHILSDATVHYLLKELNLFQANVVYNSGGGFYLVAPNITFIKERLTNAVKTIERQLFNAHGTSLFVAIDSIEVSKDALMHNNGENLRTVWDELFTKQDKKKTNKFAQLIEGNYASFFSPVMQGGDAKRDTITGEEFMPDEKPVKREDLLLKNTTNQQIELGKALRESEIMVVSDGKITYWKDKMEIEPAQLGFHYYFLKESDLAEMKEQLRASADKVSAITLNGKDGSCNFMHTMDGINNIYGFEFYGGNDFNGQSFEDMCEKDNSDFSRLGVLRMDVDNLGFIF